MASSGTTAVVMRNIVATTGRPAPGEQEKCEEGYQRDGEQQDERTVDKSLSEQNREATGDGHDSNKSDALLDAQRLAAGQELNGEHRRQEGEIPAEHLAEREAAGEIIIYDRSWYNRAGVERVMGFCTKKQHREFLEICPKFERQVVDSGIRLIKYWLEVGNKEQKRRFEARIEGRLRQWKLSPIDLPSRERWYDYSRARDMMLEATDTDFAPWYVVRSDDKKRARLNVLSHFLRVIPYEAPKRDKIKLPTRNNENAYDDEATIKDRRWIEERF